MINKLELLWSPHFIALGIYFIFGTKFSWNEGIDTCFNVECVLLGCNFYFRGGYLVVTAWYLVVTACYVVVTGGYCSLLVVTTHYRSLLLVPTFSFSLHQSNQKNGKNLSKGILVSIKQKNKIYNNFFFLCGFSFITIHESQDCRGRVRAFL